MSNRHLVSGISVVAIAAALIFFFNLQQPREVQLTPTAQVTVGNTVIDVALADNDAERAQGLSGVTQLAANEGMLFVFQEDGQHSFWMKDMVFAIDMIWIDADGRVVHVASSVSPDTYPQAFTPPLPARYVLEVRAGFALEHEIRVGSKFEFSL